MFSPAGKIEKVASKDQSRPVLTNVNLRTDADGSRWLEATDSYKLIRVPAVGATEHDVDGMIPASVFVEARKARYAEQETAITANGSVSYALKDGGRATVDRPDSGTFPDCSRLIPDSSNVVFEVGINAKLLYELAQGIGTDIVRLAFVSQDGRPLDPPSPLKPITVRPHGSGKGVDSPDTVGVIMPVRIG